MRCHPFVEGRHTLSHTPTIHTMAPSVSSPVFKRRKVEEDNEPRYSLDEEEDEEYEQQRYVPVKQRKAAELARIKAMRGRGGRGWQG